MKKRVVFVCTGNTCRSPLAEGILRALLPDRHRDRVEVSSAGTYAAAGVPPARFGRETAAEHGIDIGAIRSRLFTRDLGREADLIIVMSKNHESEVLALLPEAGDRILLLRDLLPPSDERTGLDLPDPVGGTVEAYRETFREIEETLHAGMDRIEKLLFGEEKP